MRLTAFVFGLMRQSALSSGVVAQIEPAPAATVQTHEILGHLARFRTGRRTECGRKGPTALVRTTSAADQSPTHTMLPSTTRPGPGLIPTEPIVCGVPVAACSRVSAPSSKLLIQRSP
jgi:hypothetical protein